MTFTVYFRNSCLPYSFNITRRTLKYLDTGFDPLHVYLKREQDICLRMSVAPKFFTRSQVIRFDRLRNLYGQVRSVLFNPLSFKQPCAIPKLKSTILA